MMQDIEQRAMEFGLNQLTTEGLKTLRSYIVNHDEHPETKLLLNGSIVLTNDDGEFTQL